MAKKRLIYVFLKIWILVAVPQEFKEVQNKRLERLIKEW